MSDHIGTAELIEAVRREWAAWDACISGLDEATLLAPTNAAGWSIRDLFAHLMWFEHETVQLIRTRSFTGSELWLLPPEKRNATIREQQSGSSSAELSARSAASRVALLAALATLSSSDLSAPDRFPPMPTELSPLQIIEDNTWLHYEAHRERIEEWLAARSSRG
jgi:uncharacterized protein (TIGR03083 family)